MDDERLPDFDYMDEQDDAAGFIDRGLHPTETIDLQAMMGELDSLSEAAVPDLFHNTSFGKLMEALPIPALFIDGSRVIVFANQACEKISPD